MIVPSCFLAYPFNCFGIFHKVVECTSFVAKKECFPNGYFPFIFRIFLRGQFDAVIVAINPFFHNITLFSGNRINPFSQIRRGKSLFNPLYAIAFGQRIILGALAGCLSNTFVVNRCERFGRLGLSPLRI